MQFSYTWVNYSLFKDCFHILKPLLNHIVKIPISSHQSCVELYLWSSLSFALIHSVHSISCIWFSLCIWCFFFFFQGWLDYPHCISCYPDFRSSTKSIRGKYRLQIAPHFSSISSGLVFAAAEVYVAINSEQDLQQFCLQIYLRLGCYGK